MSKPKILLVEDDKSLSTVLEHQLKSAGMGVLSHTSGEEVQQTLPALLFDIALLDVNLGNVSGFEILEQIQREHPQCESIMMTAYSNVADAKRALRQGAYDYLTKPIDQDELIHTLKNAYQKKNLIEENTQLKENLRYANEKHQMIGNSPSLQNIKTIIPQVAQSDIAVLISGESGTGKEILARQLHLHSDRRDAPFVALNCAAIQENLMESELFGHIKGAFTGAEKDREGKFVSAKGGTLFLDELSEMPLKIQAALLRALQEKVIIPVGSEQEIPVDIRLISATNKDLREEIKKGRFRDDLFYRINVYPLTLPPLRERQDDLPLLIQHFCPDMPWNASALQLLQQYTWPGNIRELENLLKFLSIGVQGREVTIEDLPPHIRNTKDRPLHQGQSLQDIEKELIMNRLNRFNGNQTQTARDLGISRSQLLYRMQKMGIKIKKATY